MRDLTLRNTSLQIACQIILLLWEGGMNHSICDILLIVTLKFLQILTELFFFNADTMGCAHLENSIGDIIPKATSLSSSVTTLFLNKKGTDLGLKNLKSVLSSTLSWTLSSFRQPKPSEKTEECLFRTSFNVV